MKQTKPVDGVVKVPKNTSPVSITKYVECIKGIYYAKPTYLTLDKLYQLIIQRDKANHQ